VTATLAWMAALLDRDAFPQTTTEPVTAWMRAAWSVIERQAPVSWLALAVVLALLLVTALRLRGGTGPTASPGGAPAPPPRFPLVWALLPFALVSVLVAFAALAGLRAPAPPADPLRVEVVGHQWWWEFRYPDAGVVTATDLHLPVGRPIRLEFSSRDTEHAFWVPAVGPPQDVLPGVPSSFTFTPERAGHFPGQCAVLCGSSHAHMRVHMFVEEPAAFDAWVASQLAPRVEPDSSRDNPRWEGRELFITHACRGCHTVRGLTEGPIGPDLTHFASRSTIAGGMFERTDENLGLWLRHAHELKPGSTMPGLPIPDRQLRPLIAWLQSLE